MPGDVLANVQETWQTLCKVHGFSQAVKHLLDLFVEARETIKRQNRYIQTLESGVAEKQHGHHGPSIGRALALAAYAKADLERAALQNLCIRARPFVEQRAYHASDDAERRDAIRLLAEIQGGTVEVGR